MARKSLPIVLVVCMSSIALYLVSAKRSLSAQTVLPPAQPTSDILSNTEKKAPESYRLPANKDLPKARFLSKEKVLPRVSKNAILKSFKLMTYRDAMAVQGEGLLSDISPDRMVVLIETDFPNGLEADNADYSNATVISIRDALTEQLIGYSITGKIKRQKGIGASLDLNAGTKPQSTKPSFCSDSKNNSKLECQQSE